VHVYQQIQHTDSIVQQASGRTTTAAATQAELEQLGAGHILMLI
jgi:hypothetical protein